MKDLTSIELPWFVSLLGHAPSHALFSKMCEEYALTTKSPADAPPAWYENAEFGVSVYFEFGKVDAIQFFSQPHRNFGGPLTPSFLGVDYSMKRDDIRRRFGEPDEVVGERTTGTIRHAGIDRYFLPDVFIAFAYAISSGQLESISFEQPEPRK
jgi:hypothetical protein